MKIYCGPTDEERIKAKEQWHRWFAWYPVRIGRTCIWLETIERQGTLHCGYDCWWSWEYRLPVKS